MLAHGIEQGLVRFGTARVSTGNRIDISLLLKLTDQHRGPGIGQSVEPAVTLDADGLPVNPQPVGVTGTDRLRHQVNRAGIEPEKLLLCKAGSGIRLAGEPLKNAARVSPG